MELTAKKRLYAWFSAKSTTNFFIRTYWAEQKSTLDEKLAYLKKNSATQSWFVCVATILLHDTQSNKFKFNSKRWIKECLEAVVIDQCPKNAKIWGRLSIKHQQIEVLAKNNMLLPHMSKQRRDCQTFIPLEMFNKMEYKLVPEDITIDNFI